MSATDPSVEQPLRFLSQALQHARLGTVDSGYRHPQLLGHFLPRDPVERQSAKDLCRRRLELLFHQSQQTLQNVLVVFLVPALTELTGGIFELVELIEEG